MYRRKNSCTACTAEGGSTTGLGLGNGGKASRGQQWVPDKAHVLPVLAALLKRRYKGGRGGELLQVFFFFETVFKFLLVDINRLISTD